MPILDSIRGLALGLVDQVNIWTDPFSIREDRGEIVDTASIDAKAKAAWLDIKANWLHGPNREFYWHMSRNDLGDMAIWHGFYTAACAYMGDTPALDLAISGIEKLVYLGGDARLCRGADDVAGEFSFDMSRKYYDEGEYVFTDNCSESSLIGVLFAVHAVRKCYQSGSDQVRRMDTVAVDIARQLRSDGMRMLNKDGSPAKFGDLRPGLFTAPIRLSAGACAILMAETAFGRNPESAYSYKQLYASHRGALLHPETHFMFVHPWYQDVIAYAVLAIQSDHGPASCRPDFMRALSRMWAKTHKEDNPLYAAMMADSGNRPSHEEQQRCLRTLQECNPTSSDLPSPKKPSRVSYDETSYFHWGIWKWKKKLSRTQLPVWKRPPADFLWQRCPYSIEGGEDVSFNWMDYCLAYAMGRWTRLW